MGAIAPPSPPRAILGKIFTSVRRPPMTYPPANPTPHRKLARLAFVATLLLIVAPLVAFAILRQQRVNEARAWALSPTSTPPHRF